MASADSGGEPRITLQEAADRLAMHYMTAYRYVRTGRLPARREGSRWTVSATDVEALLDRPARRPRGTGVPASKGQLEDRLVDGDEAGAWAVINAALASGLEPAGAHLELLSPALRSIGDRWAAGSLSVASEHRAAAVAVRVIGRLGPLFARPGRKRGAVVVGSVSGELHALPSAMLADVLRGAGFEVIDLGANTPAESFAESASSAHRLIAVLVGATVGGNDQSLSDAVRAVRSSMPGVPVLAGGAAVGGSVHAASLGAEGWSGHDAGNALAAVEGLVGAAAHH